MPMNAEPTVTLSSTVMRSPEQMSGSIDAQAVLLSIDNGKYYSMNEMGTRIWGQIQTPVQVDALVQHLLSEFDVDRLSCESDVLIFLQRLLAEHLVQIQPQ
jgi:hypothetical protein